MLINKKEIIISISFLLLGWFLASYDVIPSFPAFRSDSNDVTFTKPPINAWEKKCPYKVDSNFPDEYFNEGSLTKTSVSFAPVPIEPDPEIKIINEKFNPQEPKEVWDYWKETNWYLKRESPWTERLFDVDNDGVKEQILTADVAMTQAPHILRIVKNGNIIFKAGGANSWAEEVDDHSGFILWKTTDGDPMVRARIKTRYIYDKGKFIPIWYQESCRVASKNE